MRILFLTDCLSQRGGACCHLRQVITAVVQAGHRATVAFGRCAEDLEPPTGATGVRIRGLARQVASQARLARLPEHLSQADAVHIQNVMNPVALRQAVATGRAVATVQDHRVFCPGAGKTLSGGSPCQDTMSDGTCTNCLPDADYRARTIELTQRRQDALRGARLIVLSRYMRDELAAARLPGAAVVPPWVDVGPRRQHPGNFFLMGGRLVAHKQPLAAWRAWRRAGMSLPLHIAGTGPLTSRLEGAETLGWLDQKALERELDRARALLFPARWQEPFGILAVQALARGTPVIVADCGGTREWSDAGCLRVPPGDEDAMVSAIGRLAAEPGLALELGREGQAMVARRFARASLEPRLHHIYRSLAAHPAV